jgi:hypothetical protein
MMLYGRLCNIRDASQRWPTMYLLELKTLFKRRFFLMNGGRFSTRLSSGEFGGSMTMMSPSPDGIVGQVPANYHPL